MCTAATRGCHSITAAVNPAPAASAISSEGDEAMPGEWGERGDPADKEQTQKVVTPLSKVVTARRSSALVVSLTARTHWGNDGGCAQARTVDPLIKSQLLYQLSYTPIAGDLERFF